LLGKEHSLPLLLPFQTIQFLDMAAQQPPNWPNLRAASGRLRQSATQLVQASANIPADLGSMFSEFDSV
jgi:hypothetical protein